MVDITVKKTIAVLENKNYKIFSGGLYDLNIVGIRSINSIPNKFDDHIIVFHRNGAGSWLRHIWNITTDPGLPWLLRPLSPKGTAVLKEGQYRRAYSIDKHQGKYNALCQRNGTVKVYRDGNKNGVLDLNESSVEEGMFGINIHKSSWFAPIVNKHSAGCQVFQKEEDFNQFMTLCYSAAKKYGNKFTYTLINERDYDALF